MIAVDTSALMALLLEEPETAAIATVLQGAQALCMSAGTMAEALIVAERRGLADEMRALIDGLGIEVEPLTGGAALRVAQAYARWGKGAAPAGLDFGDCFAYALAAARNCPLLFSGDDFGRTDIMRAV